jgi:tetratricopeptide (TPR) repeat protein
MSSTTWVSLSSVPAATPTRSGPYRRGLAARPDHLEALNNLGNALVKLERANEAIAAYRRVIAAAPARADAHANLAFALRQLGRMEEALAEYRRALDLDPRYLDALNHGGFVLQELGRWDEAATLYRRALEGRSRIRLRRIQPEPRELLSFRLRHGLAALRGALSH